MSFEQDDHVDDVSDEDLERLRRRLEFKAITKACDMLDDPKTPATARASIIRGALSDSATRRHDDAGFEKDISQMSVPEMRAALARRERELAPWLASDAELIPLAPADGGVFD